MKCSEYYFTVHVIILLGIVQCEGKKKEMRYLKPPSSITLQQDDTPAILVEWSEGRSLNPSDPVTGYKVSIWEKPHVVNYSYEFVNGFWMLHEVIAKQQSVVYENKNNPFLVITTDKYTRSTLVTSVKVLARYLVQIQTLSKRGEGPMSSGVEIKIDTA